jgi:hypothetical protein
MRQKVWEISVRNSQMVSFLRQLKGRLSETIDAWDRFKRKDLGYFIIQDDSQTSLSALKSSIDVVDDSFLDLKCILKRIKQHEDELCQDNPQGVSQLSLIVRIHRPTLLIYLTEVRLIGIGELAL